MFHPTQQDKLITGSVDGLVAVFDISNGLDEDDGFMVSTLGLPCPDCLHDYDLSLHHTCCNHLHHYRYLAILTIHFKNNALKLAHSDTPLACFVRVYMSSCPCAHENCCRDNYVKVNPILGGT